MKCSIWLLIVALFHRTRGGQLAFDVGRRFLAQVEGCTGSFISPDWILTAAHCFNGYSRTENHFGDEVIDSFEEKVLMWNNGPDVAPSWTRPMSHPANVSKGQSYFRLADKVVLHGQFKGERLSWKGHDFALVHLGPDTRPAGSGAHSPVTSEPMMPICLATEGFSEFRQPLWMAGYGRRQIPYCFTNGMGPEWFQLCARPQTCLRSPHTHSCGIEFSYQDKMRYSCLREETPSAADPDCVKLRVKLPNLKGDSHVIHIFRRGVWNTTCYPVKPPEGTAGWCVVRPPSEKEDRTPTARSGWGFCSTEANQKSCLSVVNDATNTSDWQISALDDHFCMNKLSVNLAEEQPEVKRSDFDPLLDRFHVFCTGRNLTHQAATDDLFVETSEQGDFSLVPPTPKLIAQLGSVAGYAAHRIDGGPSCFGDSGGPAWRLVPHPNLEKVMVPVQVGVFSFMLWGTCIGTDEPSYYGRVSQFSDWIFRYVPRSHVCTFSSELHPAVAVKQP